MIEIVVDEEIVESTKPAPPQQFVGIAPAPEPTEISQALDGAASILTGHAAAGEALHNPDAAVEADASAYTLLFGSDDNDILKAEQPGNALIGGFGDDILISTGGNLLMGMAGNDTLDATSGDRLIGGRDADIFLLTLGEERITIRDYTPSEGDIVAILNAPADMVREGSTLVSGGKVLVEFASAGMAAAAIGEVA